MGTSITSSLSAGENFTYRSALEANPHVRYYDGRQGGYARCDVDTNRWRTDFLLTDSPDDRLSPVRRTTSFEVYPQPDPNLRDGGATQVYGKRWWRRLAAAMVRALFAIVVVLFVLGFD